MLPIVILNLQFVHSDFLCLIVLEPKFMQQTFKVVYLCYCVLELMSTLYRHKCQQLLNQSAYLTPVYLLWLLYVQLACSYELQYPHKSGQTFQTAYRAASGAM